MSGGDFGVAAMVRSSCWFQDELDLEIMQIGRGGLDPLESCTLEAIGRMLSYLIKLDGGYLFVYAQFADIIEPPKLLFTIPDTSGGWKVTREAMRALETANLTSLELPIQLGEGGPNSFVIG